MSKNIQLPLGRQALVDIVEEAVKDVLADKEVIEYIRELMAKQVVTIVEDEAVKRAIQSLVDKVVADLRVIMAKQVQKVVEERVLLGAVGCKEILSDCNKLMTNSKDTKQMVFKNDGEGMHKEKLHKRQVVDYDADVIMNDNDDVVKNIKSTEQVTMSIKQINKQAMNLLTREMDPQSSDKKQAVKDLRKLMSMMEEVVNGAVENSPEKEVVNDIKSLLGGEKANKSNIKSVTDKVRQKMQMEDVGNRHMWNKGHTGKHTRENVEEASTGEPTTGDADDDEGDYTMEDGMDIHEILRLKKIINAMNKYVVGDAK